MINTEFRFHPIGQGGFYTGKIYKNIGSRDEFNFIYDCGSLSDRPYLKKEINFFKNILNKSKLDTLNKSKLDMLVLSHLDDDHVNGLKDLLTGIKCNQIYLPYLTPIQRLIVAIRHDTKDPYLLNDFLVFLKSPHRYLLSIEGAEIGEIAYVLGNQEGEYLNRNTPSEGPISLDDNEFNLENNWDNIPESELSSDLLEIINTGNKSKIIFKKGNNALILNSIWEFYFYNEPADSNIIEQYINEVKALCGLKVTDILSQSDLEGILGDIEKLKDLRKKFRAIFKKLNETGLVLLHKPIGYKKAIFEKNCFSRHPRSFYMHRFNRYKRGISSESYENNTTNANYVWGNTLLTGDIGLIQIGNSDYIKKHLSENLIFQVPHHGSKTDWKKQYLNKCGLNRNNSTSAIIQFGYGNKYGHPRPNVIVDLINKSFDLHFCNQFEFFSYHFNLQFK
jgi:hypothetical protein